MIGLVLLAAVTTTTPVIVEAGGLDQTKCETSSHVEVLTRDDIDASGAVNMADLLEKRANIFLRTWDNPALAQISMRAMGANGFSRVRIVVDGEEMSNPDMAVQDLARIPLSSVEKVEILHGPQCVMNGGNASAGMIRIVSTGEDDYDRRTALEVRGGDLGHFGAHLSTRGGFAEELLTYHADLDFDRSDGWRENSWYELWSLKGGLKQRFANGSWIAFKAYYANSQYGLPGGVWSADGVDDWHSRSREADDGESHARNDVFGFNLSGLGVIDGENKLRAEFAFRRRHSFSYGYLDYDVYTMDYKLKYTNTSAVFGFDNQFDAGADAKHDLIWSNYNDYQRITGGVFARDEFYVLDYLSVFGGARGEWYHSRDEYRQDAAASSEGANKGEVAGEAGVNYQPVDGMKVFAKASRFFHAPLADELFSSYGVPNMDLQPESGFSAEAGFDWTFWDDFNFNFTYFHRETDDEIVYMKYQNCNAPDRTVRDGFETGFTWSRQQCGSAGVLYSYVNSREVPLVPEQTLRVYGEVYVLEWLALRGGYRFVGRQRYGGDWQGDGEYLPWYDLFDVGFRLEPTWQWAKGLTLSVTVDNLFDRRYANYGEYLGSYYVYPANGRTFMVTLRYEF